MSCRSAVLVQIALSTLVLAPAIVDAQAARCPQPSEVAIAAGVGQSDHADASASPAQFQGRGFESTMSGTFDLRTLCVGGSAEFWSRPLHAVAGSFGREHAVDAGADLDVLHSVRDSRIAAGFKLRGDLTATSHTFDDASHTTSTFRLATISLGPAVRASIPVRTARIDVSASLPLVALVDHAYNGVWSGDDAPHFRPQAWPTLRGAEAAVFIERRLTLRMGAMLGYSVRAARYDDAQPVRALSQRVLVGIALRTSGSR